MLAACAFLFVALKALKGKKKVSPLGDTNCPPAFGMHATSLSNLMYSERLTGAARYA
mgnify:CR=1 FL=1